MLWVFVCCVSALKHLSPIKSENLSISPSPPPPTHNQCLQSNWCLFLSHTCENVLRERRPTFASTTTYIMPFQQQQQPAGQRDRELKRQQHSVQIKLGSVNGKSFPYMQQWDGNFLVSFLPKLNRANPGHLLNQLNNSRFSERHQPPDPDSCEYLKQGRVLSVYAALD